MQKLVILFVSFTVFNCVHGPVVTGDIAKTNRCNELYKAACPLPANEPEQTGNRCICKEVLIEEQDGYQYTYGAALPVVGNYY
ncbi:hypothetical protein [Ferruginibacter sp.]